MHRVVIRFKYFLYLISVSVLAVIFVFLVNSYVPCSNACANTPLQLAAEPKCAGCNVTVPKEPPPWERVLDFTDFDNELGTPDGRYIVPNYVHFIKFGQREFSFPQAVCVLAALKHQRPEKLFIHTDTPGFRGKYWDVLMNTTGFKEALSVERMPMPRKIFGQPLRKQWAPYHGGDVARMQVLLKYGGIYLDSDSYIVRSLNDLRKYEFTLGWRQGKLMGNQIILCHKSSRFLKLWYESYRDNYKPMSWYYNAGQYPTESILKHMPYLVHRVEKLLGNYGIKWKTYMTAFKELGDYYALHLLSSRQNGLKTISENATYPVKFDENNVLNYPVGFRRLCLNVYPYPEEILLTAVGRKWCSSSDSPWCRKDFRFCTRIHHKLIRHVIIECESFISERGQATKIPFGENLKKLYNFGTQKNIC